MGIKLGRIKVEPQDIASCDPEEPFECAIAHALHRYGYVDPIVSFETIGNPRERNRILVQRHYSQLAIGLH